jgi:hypothetical protein
MRTGTRSLYAEGDGAPHEFSDPPIPRSPGESSSRKLPSTAAARLFTPLSQMNQNHDGNHHSRTHELKRLKREPEVVEQPYPSDEYRDRREYDDEK